MKRDASRSFGHGDLNLAAMDTPTRKYLFLKSDQFERMELQAAPHCISLKTSSTSQNCPIVMILSLLERQCFVLYFSRKPLIYIGWLLIQRRFCAVTNREPWLPFQFPL
jgi:hypothetical protein